MADSGGSSPERIEEMIGKAHALFQSRGGALRRHPGLTQGLDRLRREAAASGEAMYEFGVVAACRQCDEKEGGSCCGAGIENHYTPLLLLLNLLLDVELPQKRRWADSCFFLREGGCALTARHILCINYLCLRLQQDLSLEKLIKLQTITGREMETVFRLHEELRRLTEE